MLDKVKFSQNVIGTSVAMQHVMCQVERVAPANATVLIQGETGTGKELIAREIHARSKYKDRPMIVVNCATLPSELAESELFGSEKGAYTGSVKQQKGRFELADGSTIFLDEIGDLPLNLQVKLLRVLQEGEFERLGSSRTIKVDVRVIAATNRPLEKLIQGGDFREDLFYRLNVFPIELPPLRERCEDIGLIANHYIDQLNRDHGKQFEGISERSLRELCAQPWPGNVRELQNVLERAAILCNDPLLEIEIRRDGQNSTGSNVISNATLEAVERHHITSMLERSNWQISGTSGAACLLGLKPTTLRSKMDRLGIQKPS